MRGMTRGGRVSGKTGWNSNLETKPIDEQIIVESILPCYVPAIKH